MGSRTGLLLAPSPGSAMGGALASQEPGQQRHGFQYVDWLFDGDDLVVVSRTAFDDAEGGAHNYHDANYLTFHRVKDFRSRSMADSCVDPKSLGW